MLLISDNSATDIVIRLAGGPEAVTAKLRELGIAGINVNRPTVNLIADAVGATLPPETSGGLSCSTRYSTPFRMTRRSKPGHESIRIRAILRSRSRWRRCLKRFTTSNCTSRGQRICCWISLSLPDRRRAHQRDSSAGDGSGAQDREYRWNG